MAAGYFESPGSEFGPCRNRCQHVDCKDTKRMARSKCPHCGKRIGWTKRFYVLETNPETNAAIKLAHASCHERDLII